ncbi:MAG TPA: hypothetical protein VHM70_19075 [Polyangiaceae bacterium]|jgi:hypothetical protein|nr:hypothetical protein [Polyangiaceae bacterium]
MAKLLVYLHVAMKQRAFQGELERLFPNIEITAVGRLPDFDRAISGGQDAVLSLQMVLDAKGLATKLRGYRAGAADEAYSLASVDVEPNPAVVGTVGALDILGREGTTEFVHRLLPSQPKVERVTKVEDMLPLLQMRRVDGIVLPGRLIAELQTASRMNLLRKDLAVRVALPAVASLTGAGASVVSAIKSVPRATQMVLGVDEWR